MHTTNAENGSNYLTYQGRFKGLFGWIFSTDHKRIGLLYLYGMMTMFTVGVLLGLAMKFELLAPGKTIMGRADVQCYFYRSRSNYDFYDCNSRRACGIWKPYYAHYDWGA